MTWNHLWLGLPLYFMALFYLLCWVDERLNGWQCQCWHPCRSGGKCLNCGKKT